MAKKKKIRVKKMVQGVPFDQTFDTQKEADAFIKLLEALKVGHLGSNQHQKQISLAKAWCKLLDEKKEDDLDSKTIEGAMKPLRLFGDLLRKNIMDINPDEFVAVFEEARNFYNGKPLAMRTLENYALTFKEVLQVSIELGVTGISVKKINKRIMKVVKAIGVPEKVYTAYTRDEVDRLLSSKEIGPEWVRLYIRASLASFKRPGELMALGWPDINFDSRQILINKQITSGKFKSGLKSGGPAHYVEMDEELYSIFTRLKEIKEEQANDSDWVFSQLDGRNSKPFVGKDKPPYKGKPISRMSIKNYVQDDMRAAGVPVKKIHDLRRTAATLFYLESSLGYKMTMAILKKRLNHASLQTTEQYISISEDFLNEQIQKAKNTSTSSVTKLSEKIKELEERKAILELELEVKQLEEKIKQAA